MSIQEFEEMTPYQLNLVIQNYAEREKEKFELKLFEIYLTSAWISRWVWAKRIPKFDSIMDRLQPKKHMTDEQMLEQVKALNIIFGGEVNIVEN